MLHSRPHRSQPEQTPTRITQWLSSGANSVRVSMTMKASSRRTFRGLLVLRRRAGQRAGGWRHGRRGQLGLGLQRRRGLAIQLEDGGLGEDVGAGKDTRQAGRRRWSQPSPCPSVRAPPPPTTPATACIPAPITPARPANGPRCPSHTQPTWKYRSSSSMAAAVRVCACAVRSACAPGAGPRVQANGEGPQRRGWMERVPREPLLPPAVRGSPRPGQKVSPCL